jgi:hypothetical protein
LAKASEGSHKDTLKGILIGCEIVARVFELFIFHFDEDRNSRP